MTGYAKLFDWIVRSTVWGYSHTTRIVWITMLAVKDKDGIVWGSVPGLAHAARVTIGECQEAIDLLSAPDPYSRSEEHDGRRIEAVDGGWRVLNHEKYQRLQSAEDRREKNAERQRRFRKRKKAVTPGVTQRNASNASNAISSDTDADTEREENARETSKGQVEETPKSKTQRLVDVCIECWPGWPEMQVEQSLLILLPAMTAARVDPERTIRAARLVQPPTEGDYLKAHTWIARQINIEARDLERTRPPRPPSPADFKPQTREEYLAGLTPEDRAAAEEFDRLARERHGGEGAREFCEMVEQLAGGMKVPE